MWAVGVAGAEVQSRAQPAVLMHSTAYSCKHPSMVPGQQVCASLGTPPWGSLEHEAIPYTSTGVETYLQDY